MTAIHRISTRRSSTCCSPTRGLESFWRRACEGDRITEKRIPRCARNDAGGGNLTRLADQPVPKRDSRRDSTLVYMLRPLAFLALAVSAAASLGAASFSGSAALEFTKQAVAFGPRPSGSEAIHKLQAYILSQIKPDGCEVIEDAFTAKTLKGEIAMKNIMCKFPGKSGKAIAITGHYDTKLFPGRRFVGANDGGSSTGFLLELAHVLARQPRVDDVYVVFFDGE